MRTLKHLIGHQTNIYLNFWRLQEKCEDNFYTKKINVHNLRDNNFWVKKLSHKINIITITYIYKKFKTSYCLSKEHLAWFLAFIGKV